MFNKGSVTVTSNCAPVTIHLVSCGAVAVKTRFRNARFSGIPAMLDFMADRKFTEWLPIWVMIIEHPEGVFVIDAGEIAEVNRKDYFKLSGYIANWFDRSQFKFAITREEEIDRQLQSLRIPAEKIKSVVITHLHFDHTDGIKHFPSTEICVSGDEWQRPFGDLPKLYPSWFKPVLLEMNTRYDVFYRACPLTQAKDIWLVETPGHTYHHCSVLLALDGINIMFAADICYTQQQLLQGGFPGNTTSNKTAQKTYDAIRQFAKNHPLVFLPSHDAEAATRLQNLALLSE
ncbi:MAG TPA: N-acyl homoserine lactonase family protein [Chitinophagaceae bacterium]|nr:N-acyl homoserine lactonase family protein [Chitinophagaceae bacterium]